MSQLKPLSCCSEYDMNLIASSPGLIQESGASTLYLWFGCVDDYCNPSQMIGVSADKLLVYKNLAHQINPKDLNCLSVLHHAVHELRIQHIIVCGHDNCAVLRDTAQNNVDDFVENWLEPIQRLYQKYERQLELYDLQTQRLDKVCELNVIQQVRQLCETTVVQEAWKQDWPLTIHGWAYSSKSGLLRDLINEIASQEAVIPAYDAAIRACLGEA